MGKHNYRMWKLISVILIMTALPFSYAFAADMRVAVAQNQMNKPVVRDSSNAVIDLRGSTNISKKNPKITLSLKNTDVKPVLRMFADKAGINLILHPSVKGVVNLDLVNVPLNDAFRMVLQVTDLTYTQDGNTIIVSASNFARISGISKQSINTVPINYVDASLLANFLNQNIFSKKTPGLSNWDVVVTNANRNELLVFGTQNDLAMVKKVVAKFDVPPLNTTFTVKHTTPAEMATLVCRMLKMTESELDQSSQSTQWDFSSTLSNPGNQSSGGRSTGFAANISKPKRTLFNFGSKGVVTGFASAGSSGGSSEGSSGGGGSIQLGKNIVACTIGGSESGSGSSGGSGGGASSGGGKSGGSAGSSSGGGASGGSASMKLRSLGDQKMIISYFPQRGTINLLGGSKSIVNRISKFIEENDIKQPQAMMDITIIELNETGQKDLTTSFDFVSRSFTLSTSAEGSTMGNAAIGPNIPLSRDDRQVVAGGDTVWLDRSIFYKLTGAPQIKYYFNYIVKSGKGRVVANPKVLITNGEPSTIDLTSQYIDTVKSELIQNSNSGNITGIERTYNKADDLGLKFEMVPFISPEGYISINFTTSYSTPKEEVTAAIGGGTSEKELVATLLNQRKLELRNIRIKDNETLLIGGLVQEDEVKTVAKVPFFGDLPVVGILFRSTTHKREKGELIILLTPRILKDTEDIGIQESDSL